MRRGRWWYQQRTLLLIIFSCFFFFFYLYSYSRFVFVYSPPTTGRRRRCRCRDNCTVTVIVLRSRRRSACDDDNNYYYSSRRCRIISAVHTLTRRRHTRPIVPRSSAGSFRRRVRRLRPVRDRVCTTSYVGDRVLCPFVVCKVSATSTLPASGPGWVLGSRVRG